MKEKIVKMEETITELQEIKLTQKEMACFY